MMIYLVLASEGSFMTYTGSSDVDLIKTGLKFD